MSFVAFVVIDVAAAIVILGWYQKWIKMTSASLFTFSAHVFYFFHRFWFRASTKDATKNEATLSAFSGTMVCKLQGNPKATSRRA